MEPDAAQRGASGAWAWARLADVGGVHLPGARLGVELERADALGLLVGEALAELDFGDDEARKGFQQLDGSLVEAARLVVDNAKSAQLEDLLIFSEYQR